MPWGEDPVTTLPFDVAQHDLEDADAPAALLDEVVERHGRIDIVVGDARPLVARSRSPR